MAFTLPQPSYRNSHHLSTQHWHIHSSSHLLNTDITHPLSNGVHTLPAIPSTQPSLIHQAEANILLQSPHRHSHHSSTQQYQIHSPSRPLDSRNSHHLSTQHWHIHSTSYLLDTDITHPPSIGVHTPPAIPSTQPSLIHPAQADILLQSPHRHSHHSSTQQRRHTPPAAILTSTQHRQTHSPSRPIDITITHPTSTDRDTSTVIPSTQPSLIHPAKADTLSQLSPGHSHHSSIQHWQTHFSSCPLDTAITHPPNTGRHTPPATSSTQPSLIHSALADTLLQPPSRYSHHSSTQHCQRHSPSHLLDKTITHPHSTSRHIPLATPSTQPSLIHPTMADTLPQPPY